MFKVFNKKSNLIVAVFLFNSFIFVNNSFSRTSDPNSFTLNPTSYILAENNIFHQLSFDSKPTLFKLYGPLLVDMNNIKYQNRIFLIPTINDQSKPLFLAIYCDDSLINVKGSSDWKGWQGAFHTFEYNLVNKLCSTID